MKKLGITSARGNPSETVRIKGSRRFVTASDRSEVPIQLTMINKYLKTFYTELLQVLNIWQPRQGPDAFLVAKRRREGTILREG